MNDNLKKSMLRRHSFVNDLLASFAVCGSPMTLDDLSVCMDCTEKQARGAIDNARNAGHIILSMGHGTKTWKLVSDEPAGRRA